VDPAITYYSTDNDASIRIESRYSSGAKEVYLELGNQNRRRNSGWKIGMKNDHHLSIGYGELGTMSGMAEVMRFGTTGNIDFYGAVEFKGVMYRNYADSAGMTCVNGNSAQTSSSWAWTSWAYCPAGYEAVGIGEAAMIAGNTYEPDIDHVVCENSKCRLYCRGAKCRVRPRCCKTDSAALVCTNGPTKTQTKGQWGTKSTCSSSYEVVGYGRLDLQNHVYYTGQYINDFEIGSTGQRYARAWCWGSNCAVKARCCKPSNSGESLQCIAGAKVTGSANMWSAYSSCSAGYVAVSTKRIDLLGSNSNAYQNMNRYECADSGCRAYCAGSNCNLWSLCCRVAVNRL
jgi:hypothetical protein